MKILFISRAYPPVTGGIENQNYALSVWLKKFADVTTIANRHGKKALFLFFPYVTIRVLFTASRYDVILLGDGVLASVGFIIKRFYPRKAIVSVIHGLDLTFPSNLYQKLWVRHFIPSLDGLIAVSRETREIALKKNITDTKIAVIPNGVDPKSLQNDYTRSDLEKLLGRNLSETHVLLTAGRLAKRKGVEWFIRNVLPTLPESVFYVISGTGPEEKNIRSAIRETHTENRTKMLGRVSDADRNLLLNTVDLFVQPNIPIPGDLEGFGIAVIEATACGRPVVASDLEGLKDAVCQNESGILVEAGNAPAFQDVIIDLITNTEKRQSLGKRALAYTEAHYHWNIIARLYVEALEQFIKK